MEELSVFRWDESLLASTAAQLSGAAFPFDQPGGGELCLGGGHVLACSSNKLQTEGSESALVWRLTGEGNLDVAVVSWRDARATRMRRFVMSAPPCRTGVFYCESEGGFSGRDVLAVCSVVGELFLILDPFTSRYQPRRVHSIGSTPTACCWSSVQSGRELLCWAGLDDGVTNLCRVTPGGELLSVTAIESVTGPTGWLSALSRTRKCAVLALAPASGSTKNSSSSSVAALYADGRARVLTFDRDSTVKLSEICPVFGGNEESRYEWHDGRVMSIVEGEESLSFVFSIVSTRENMRLHPVKVQWASTGDRIVERTELRLPSPPDSEDDAYDFRGLVFNPRSRRLTSLYWNPDQGSGCITDGDSTLGDSATSSGVHILDGTWTTMVQLPDVVSRLEGHFFPSHVSKCVRQAFSTQFLDEASQLFAQASPDRRRAFANLLKAELEQVWRCEKEVLETFSGFGPSTLGAIVRREGLSLIVPSVSPSIAAMASRLTVMRPPEAMVPPRIRAMLGDRIRMEEMEDRSALSIGRAELNEMATDGLAEIEVVSSAKMEEYIQTFSPSSSLMTKSNDDDESEHRGMAMNAVIVGDLLRKRSMELVYSSLLFALLLSRAERGGGSDVRIESKRVAAIESSLSLAREAYAVHRVLSRVNVFFSDLRPRRVNPLMIAPRLIAKDAGETIPTVQELKINVPSSAILFQPMTGTGEEEESNLVWTWTMTVAGRVLGSLDSNERSFWSSCKSRLFSAFNPLSLQSPASASWLLLTRPDDYPTLFRSVCAPVIDQGSYPSLNGRIISIFSGCISAYESLVLQKDVVAEAKRDLIRGAPVQQLGVKAVYFSECARLFEELFPTVCLFFLRQAQSLSHAIENRDAVAEVFARSFRASLEAGELAESFEALVKLPDRGGQGENLKRLVGEIVSSRRFDVLLGLPLEYYPDSLFPLAIALLKAKCRERYDRDLLLALYALLSKYKRFEQAAEITFQQSFVAPDAQEQLSAVNLSLTACMQIPQRAAAVQTTSSPSSPKFFSDVRRRFALLSVQVALHKCSQRDQGNDVDDERKLVKNAMEWLRMEGSLGRPFSTIHQELIVALVELVHVCRTPLKVRDQVFRTIGQLSDSLAVERTLKLALSSKEAQTSAKRARFASCALRAHLERNPQRPVKGWWRDVFTQSGRLDVYVEILSDSGRWLDATEAALGIVPDKPVLPGSEVLFPTRVLDKVLSRATRYREGTDEAKLVVDVVSKHDLDTARRNLEDKIRRVFA